MLKFENHRIPSFTAVFGKGAKERLADYVNSAKLLQKEYHKHWLYFLFDIFVCKFFYGADLNDDYLYFKMYKMKSHERNKYVTYGRFVKITKWFFTDYANEYTDSKKGFLEHYKPFHKRDYVLCPHEYNEGVENLLKGNKYVFFKEDYSNCANGVRRFESDQLLSNKNLLKELLSSNGVIEAGVVQCREMAALNPSSCNTLRLTTMVEKDGAIRFFSAALRVGGIGAYIDNIHAGGCAFHVDVETGIVLSAGRGLQGEYCIFSPTGIVVPGMQIPHWDKVKREIVEAAKVCPEARFVGWDVAITDNGPVIIEANNASSGTVFQYDGGKWEYFLAQK